MTRALFAVGLSLALLSSASAAEISGSYLETRTCQVYTGPCFANAEVGLAGQDAIMAWNIKEGAHQGVDLAGLSVVVVVRASDTLGFGGIEAQDEIKSIILVDDKADAQQREALIDFAKSHSGKAGADVARVDSQPIEMSLNAATLEGNLTAGDEVKLSTRKAGKGDCICSNESAYYPPLAEVSQFAPGVTLEGEFKGRGLKTRWSTPGDRSSYMALFEY